MSTIVTDIINNYNGYILRGFFFSMLGLLQLALGFAFTNVPLIMLGASVFVVAAAHNLIVFLIDFKSARKHARKR